MRYRQILLDTDFCIKIGGSPRFSFLYEILPLITEEIYMHDVVYGELLHPQCAKDQIDKLIQEGYLKLVSESELSRTETTLYNATKDMLVKVMMDPRFPRKNKGEVCSLAYAKSKSIAVFVTDESNLQTIVDRYLNTGVHDIQCLCIKDIVEYLRNNETVTAFPRKLVKVMWAIAGKDKAVFDTSLWPL